MRCGRNNVPITEEEIEKKGPAKPEGRVYIDDKN
jgi:hypothetical protein